MFAGPYAAQQHAILGSPLRTNVREAASGKQRGYERNQTRAPGLP
jgi:hypothetical protein